MKHILFIFILGISFASNADDSLSLDNKQIDLNYLSPTYGLKKQSVYNTEEEMVKFLLKNREKTYMYYNKLDVSQKVQVFKEHQNKPEKNLTHIILEIYMNRS